MNFKLLNQWLRERQLYIALFILFFLFLDSFTTFVGIRLGGFEVNPIVRPTVEAGYWLFLFLAKVVGTVLLLYGFYFLYKLKETQKKCVTVMIAGRKYKTYIADTKLIEAEIFAWGLFLGINGLIILMNVATILMFLG